MDQVIQRKGRGLKAGHGVLWIKRKFKGAVSKDREKDYQLGDVK